MAVSGATYTLYIIGRCNDKSAESIASPAVSKKAFLQGFSFFELIPMVRLKVTFKKEEESTEYTFSRAWTVPPTVLHLSVSQLALKNIK